jgi:signal transduction histidine kinase
MGENGRAHLRRYAGSVALTLAVVAGRLVMNPIWGEHSNRHLVFLPMTMVVAWLWGFGPALVAAGLATAGISYYWTEPTHQFNFGSDLVMFFALAVIIARLIASLHLAGRRADEASRAREQVLAVVAHDLRNPLTAIQLNLASLRVKVAGHETAQRQVDTVERATARMERLIADLVDATRLEQGGVELAIGDEPVEGILGESVEMFAAQAREKGLTLEATGFAERSTVRCDRTRLLQVLANLLANALRFTPSGGQVSVRAEVVANSVRFEVADTGPGIPAENLPHVFERYWHGDRKGAGLGLFIAQSLIRAQGGKIEIDSQPGLGARFFFSLPRSATPAAGVGRAPVLQARGI